MSGPAASTAWMGATERPTRTLLLRHGETPLSTERRFAGVGDIPLTTRGIDQANAAARALAGRADSIEVIAASPLSRARRTAEIAGAALGLSVSVADGLRETDFGAWEGFTFAEVRSRWPAELDAWLADQDAAPPGGESFSAVRARVTKAKEDLLTEHRHRTILVVSHVTPIKVFVQLALQAPPESIYRMHLDVSSLSAVDWFDDGPAVLRAFNDTSHLTT